jgi:DinB superfamily
MATCPECGFTYGAAPRQELSRRLSECGDGYGSRLVADAAVLRARPTPEQWSPLEYACHVRDVALMQRDRLYVALVEDEPSFKPMYRDQRVAFDRYDTQAPAAVAQQVKMAADLLANGFAGLEDGQWSRTLMYGYPDPARRDVEWMAHHALHELIHHLADIDGMVGTV